MLEIYVNASNLIRGQGVSGAIEASLLLGMEATTAMLMVHLHGSDTQRANTVEEWFAHGFADVSLLNGRAVIYGKDGSLLAALEVSADATECCEIETKGLHVPMWMQGSEIKTLFAGSAPYGVLKELMLREKKKVDASLKEQLEQMRISVT